MGANVKRLRIRLRKPELWEAQALAGLCALVAGITTYIYADRSVMLSTANWFAITGAWLTTAVMTRLEAKRFPK